jgi:hypothetical protein
MWLRDSMQKKDCSLNEYSDVCTTIRKTFSLDDMIALKKLLDAFIENRIIKMNPDIEKMNENKWECYCIRYKKYGSCRHVAKVKKLMEENHLE